MRRCLVHVHMGGEHTQIRIAFLKSANIIIKCLFCKSGSLLTNSKIVFIANLNYYFMKWFFLFTVANFFIIVFYFSVIASLLGVITLNSFVKQFMINIFYIVIYILFVQVRPFGICIRGIKYPAVML